MFKIFIEIKFVHLTLVKQNYLKTLDFFLLSHRYYKCEIVYDEPCVQSSCVSVGPTCFIKRFVHARKGSTLMSGERFRVMRLFFTDVILTMRKNRYRNGTVAVNFLVFRRVSLIKRPSNRTDWMDFFLFRTPTLG